MKEIKNLLSIIAVCFAICAMLLCWAESRTFATKFAECVFILSSTFIAKYYGELK